MLQPLLACINFETFKSMMIQKNIDLELQALTLLQTQIGQSIDVYQQNPDITPSPTIKEKLAKRDADEERILQDALKLSKEELDQKQMDEEKEMDKLLELAIQESLKSYEQENLKKSSDEVTTEEVEESNKEKQVKNEVTTEKVEESSTKKQAKSGLGVAKLLHESSNPSKHDLIPLVVGCKPVTREISGQEAAQLWIESAKSELEIRQSPIVKKRVSVSTFL